MAKVLYVIMSGDEKFDFATRMAYNTSKGKAFEDVKVIFFGPSQKRLTQIDGELKKMFQEMLANKVIDSACINAAEMMNIKPQLEGMGLSLLPSGQRIAYYLNQGYQVLTF